jgi:hypothetical protein
MTASASKPPILGTAREWAIDIAVGVAIGLLLGLMGPFGTFFNGRPALRILYWVGSIVCGMVMFGTLTRGALLAIQRTRAPAWTVVPVVVLVGSAAQGALSRIAAVAIWPHVAQAVSPLVWYGQCVATTTPIVIVYYLLRIRPLAYARGPAPHAPVDAPAPAADPGAVLYLKMEDHYVRIRTEHGSRLEMGPLARVTAGLGGVEGLQTHRSWWVARRAIVGVERDGRNLRLRLLDGESAPVSRASVAKLRAAGWLAEGAAP